MKTRLHPNEWRNELASIRSYQDPELEPPCVGKYYGPGQQVEPDEDEVTPATSGKNIKEMASGMRRQIEWLKSESNRRKRMQPEVDRLRNKDLQYVRPRVGWWWDREWDEPKFTEPKWYAGQVPRSYNEQPNLYGRPLRDFLPSIREQWEQARFIPEALEEFRRANAKIIREMIEAKLVSGFEIENLTGTLPLELQPPPHPHPLGPLPAEQTGQGPQCCPSSL